MDKVFIKGLEVEGIIGIFQWEREVKPEPSGEEKTQANQISDSKSVCFGYA